MSLHGCIYKPPKLIPWFYRPFPHFLPRQKPLFILLFIFHESRWLQFEKNMRKSGIVAVSVAAASASAISASTSTASVSFSSPELAAEPKTQVSLEDSKPNHRKMGSDSADEKFAPRFDGLRFIETLVTAHR